MPNTLRTDYIANIGEQYDPMRPTRNALAIRGAESDLAQQAVRTQGMQQENVLRQGQIGRQGFSNEKDVVDFYIKTRPLATEQTWKQYRQMILSKGVDPSMVPEEYDANYMKESDTTFAKFLAEQQRKEAGFTLEQQREQKKFERTEAQAKQKFSREQEQARQKFDFELKKLSDKTDDKSIKEKADSARQFIQSLSKDKQDTFGLMLAAMATGGKLDPSLIKQGEAEIPPKLKPAYDRAIKILEEYYGVPAQGSTMGRMRYNVQTGKVEPIQ